MAKNQYNLLEKIWSSVKENTKKLNKIDKHVAVMNSELGEVKDDMKDIKTKYVTLERFSPIEKIVFALTGGALAIMFRNLLSLVLK